MADRLRGIPKMFLEWWNKFSPKQKTVIVCALSGVILAVGILAYALTRPQYVVIANCETPKEASEVTEILDSNDIPYQTSTDALSVSVLKSREGEANLVLGAQGIMTTTYGIEEVTAGGFSTTESDKQKRYIVYKESKMESDLQTNDFIDKAYVTLSIPEDDGTLIAQNETSAASVVLQLAGEMPQETASSIAHFIATALGSSSTDKITIIDTQGNLLYSGETQASGAGNASTQLAMKQEAENLVKQEVKSVLLGTNLYDNIEVASNLDLDFSSTERTDHNYTPAEDQTQGVLASEDLYTAESAGGTGGAPGTDSNTENNSTYVMENSSESNETVTEESRKYLPNESVIKQNIPPGLIQYDTSSISVTAKRLHVYNEDEVESQGLLVDMSWEAFKNANAEQVKLDVDEDMYSIVQTATGIASENITIVAYEVPVFVDAEGSAVGATDIVQIVLIIAILGVLAFVVIRSMRSQREEQPEEELSVETLLQSTPEEDLEDIELEGKSEARKLIEKFVDENPEAVANLLRNWLTEDWG